MSERKKNKIGAARWAKEIDEIVAFADANRGFRSELEERLKKRFRDPKKNWRIMVGVWITSNDERRTEPLAGTGLVVVEEARKLMDEWEQ